MQPQTIIPLHPAAFIHIRDILTSLVLSFHVSRIAYLCIRSSHLNDRLSRLRCVLFYPKREQRDPPFQHICRHLEWALGADGAPGCLNGRRWPVLVRPWGKLTGSEPSVAVVP